jgi:hypothetical protein
MVKTPKRTPTSRVSGVRLACSNRRRRTGSTSRLSSNWPLIQDMADSTWTMRTKAQMVITLGTFRDGRLAPDQAHREGRGGRHDA